MENVRERVASDVSWTDSTKFDDIEVDSEVSSIRDMNEVKSNALFNPMPSIDEDQFASPFADFDAHEQPIKEQLQKQLEMVNHFGVQLHSIENAISMSMSEVWGYWADPIQLHLHPIERVDVQDLISTDNELLNKVLTVFAVLCDEVSELKLNAETSFYPALIMFGQAKHGDDEVISPGEDELYMGRMLPLLQRMANFVDRCHLVAENMIHQLASLYHSLQKLWKSTFKHTHLRPVFDGLANLLEILVTLDGVVLDNPNIGTAWDKYKRMMQYVRADPERYSMNREEVISFERLMVNLDQTIMSGQALQACIEKDFEVLLAYDEQDDDGSIDVRNNKVFLQEFFFCIQERYRNNMTMIGTSSETFERRQLVGTFALYALYRKLLPPNVLPDAAFYKLLWETQSRVPCVTLCGKVVWYSADFLLKYAPFATKKLVPSDVGLFRREFLQKLDESMPEEIRLASMELNAWLVRMESFMQPTTRNSGDTARILNIRGNLILKGLALALRVQNTMHTMLNLHTALNTPMQKRIVRPLYQCIEILKAIEFMFARKNVVLAESITIILTQIADGLLAHIRPIKTQLEASKRFDDTKLDILAALTVVDDVLRSGESFSYTRQIVLALAMRVATIDSTLNGSSKAIEEPLKLLWKLNLFGDFQRKIKDACDTSFFYWSRTLLGTFIADLYTVPEQANRIQYVISGFTDACRLLNAAGHEESNAPYVEAYSAFLEEALEENLVMPLCLDIENDLRLHVHSVYFDNMETPNPKQDENLKVLYYFLDLKPLRLIGSFLDLRQRVTRYLERTFYNLTTVALHDWKTYGEMKNLANEKYGLTLAENHLPMGSLDQGLDILQIMRNIHIFVARYNYNINQQFFLERRTDKGSKHLNSINIHSIASSIRTHGMGIMNTTVNFTYQFLTKKFDIFSQFLFDEYIKSYLLRERRWYKMHRDDKEYDNQYPYDRAFQFNKDIRKLGISDTGKTFLDQFRLLITEIGNALGYVRMVRSAGMNYCSNAIKFVPELNKNAFQFEPYISGGRAATLDEDGNVLQEEIKGTSLSEESIAAAKNLDSVISNLSRNFSENNDYFSILVQIFREVMINAEQKHLETFYQILPALTINFVETSVQAKDLMYKNSRRKESYFSDDGFAIGIAYILAILNQSEQFDGLHWFDSVSKKHVQDEEEYNIKQAEREKRKQELERRNMQETTAELIDDEEEIHTLQLTARRIEQQRREFDLLNWSVNGARIFFKE